ncbi:H-NS histone family protein [Paraburkholderia xenovorans]|uniref:H-NS histone family protein n=1 Tax=Paraburkholderia xenovorans TaxID=36873 RepID=UPI0005A0FB73|nr:H-NS family nucleoid-associated regulatory protein [Paraburkholderia xenovorans]
MATLEQIQARLKKLQAQAEAIVAKQSSAVLETIRGLMEKHGLTTKDIDAHLGSKKRGPKAGAKAAAKTAKSVAKYRDPKSGATWTGHGRAPAWIANVKDRAKFLIASGDEAAVAVAADVLTKAKTAGTKTASKSVGASGGTGQRKGPQPALYRDPKSGATWSGRGPAPAWLAGAKDRTKFLIDGVSGVADSLAASKRKAVAKNPATKTVVAKKVPAKKLVGAKKAATKASVAAAPEAVTTQPTA